MRISAGSLRSFGLTTRRKTKEDFNGIRGQKEFLKPRVRTIIWASQVLNPRAKLTVLGSGVW